ncbi:hypothetical protein MMC14_000822 [Varicellaria rhodocarpa]|nr:hypothetical protein [Varicellaria rhodocarpa]
MKQHAISKILLSFQNSESFDGTVLAEIIDIFRAWSDRISTIFIFDITISIENFQEKLPRATLRHLQGIVFESTDAEETLDLLFRAITSPNVHGQLRIGSALMKTIIDRQLEHIQSGHAFIQAVKYAYIIHYFTNPLSILTDRNDSAGALQREHYEVIRDLPSFRRCTQKMVDSKELDKVQSLLDDDEILDKFTTTLIDHGQKSLRGILCALDVASKIQSCIPEKLSLRWSELYIKGLSANLANSNFIRDLLLSVRKFPSDTMHTLLEALSQTPNLATAIRPIQTALRTLTAAHPSSTTAPLRSEHDLRHHETLRTTIVAQKVSLSKHKATLSKQDAAYSQLVARVDTALRTYFNEYLIDPKDLVFHEIFIHDARASCRDVFMPAPRRAIERALSAPHDYLNCECCEGGGKGDAAALSSSQPATAILYQLYLESGALINIADLWAAFSAVVGTEGEEEKGEAEKKDDDDDDEERKLALFYRALAELKYLGMIKNSRKRTDHLTKLAWKGL